MDDTIRLIRIDKEKVVGVFAERDRFGNLSRVLEVSLEKMIGSDYECINFHAKLDGTFEFNENSFDSLDSLLAAKDYSSPEERRLRKEKIEFRTNKRYDEARIFLDNMIMMYNSAIESGGISPIQKIMVKDARYVYVSVDSSMNVIIGVPSNVEGLSNCLMDTREYKSLLNKAVFGRVSLVGGGPQLKEMNNLFEGIECKEIDFSNLYYKNVEDTSETFMMASVENLDLTWTKQCKIKKMHRMFKRYAGKKIPVNQMNLKYVESMGATFTGTRAELDFTGMDIEKGETPNLVEFTNTFNRYKNNEQVLDLRWVNTSNVKSIDFCFEHTEVKQIDISNWGLEKLRGVTLPFNYMFGELIINKELGRRFYDQLNGEHMKDIKITIVQ